MAELVMAMDKVAVAPHRSAGRAENGVMATAHWDTAFSEALWRLLQLEDSPEDQAVLGRLRLRELYYAVLKGDAGTVRGGPSRPATALPGRWNIFLPV